MILITSWKAYGAEDSTYSFNWLDRDKEVYVLQNRKYRKVGSVFLNVGYGNTVSGAFVDATTLQGKAGYFFNEEFGFEVIFAKTSGEENTTATSVRNPGGPGSTPFRRIVDGYQGGLLLWAPFYSKLNTFNKIIYMDWIFGLGYAQLEETNNKLEFKSGGLTKTFTTEDHTGFVWEVAAQFYLTESIHLRLDLTTVHYKALGVALAGQTAEDAYRTNWDVTVGLGIRL